MVSNTVIIKNDALNRKKGALAPFPNVSGIQLPDFNNEAIQKFWTTLSSIRTYC